jgi:hypothetical protein
MEKKIEKKEKENSENCKLKHQETAEKKKIIHKSQCYYILKITSIGT